MHGEKLGGPVLVFALVVVGLTGLLALFVTIDSLRPKRRASAHVREPLWTYTLLQGLWLVAMVVGQAPVVPRIVVGVAGLAIPLVLAQAVAYLLRVVFPKPVEGAEGEDGSVLDAADTADAQEAAEGPELPV